MPVLGDGHNSRDWRLSCYWCVVTLSPKLYIHCVFFPLIVTPLLLLLLFSSFRYSVHLVLIFFSSSHFFLSPTDCLLHRWSRKSQNWWWKHCVCVNLVVPAPRCKSNLSQNSSWSSGLVVSTTDWPHSITTLSATRYIPTVMACFNIQGQSSFPLLHCGEHWLF